MTCLISQAQRLSSQNLLVPLRKTIDAFLSTPSLSSRDLNQFLCALTALPYRNAEGMRNVERVLGEIRSLDQVDDDTWVRLVRASGLGTGKGEGALRLARKIHGWVEEPDEAILRALLHVYAKHGALSDARQCFQSIVALRGDAAADPVLTTTLLGAFDDKEDAMAFLRSSPVTASIHAHTTALHVAAKDLRTSTHNLIRSFMLIPPDTLTTPTYTVLIRGLLLRKEYRLASMFFDKLLKKEKSRSLSLDNPALAAGLEALTRHGQPHVAFQVLERYGGTTATTITLNQFLVSLNRIGRPDISIRLFTHMQTLYGCLPNSQTLSILFQTARLAVKLDASPSTPRLRRLAPFGSAKIKKDGPKTKIQTAQSVQRRRSEVVDEILSAVGHPSRGGLRRYVDGNYDGLDPARFARDVFDRVLAGVMTTGTAVVTDDDGDTVVVGRRPLVLGPLPPPPPLVADDDDTRHVSDIGLTISHLSKFRERLTLTSSSSLSSSSAVISDDDGDDDRYVSDIGLAMAHVRRLKRAFVGSCESGGASSPRQARSFPLGSELESAAYPGIVPTNSNFFNYIFLVCCLPDPKQQSPPPTPHQIPHAFSTMRQLGVQPSNSTLAIGLVGWWDVCVAETEANQQDPPPPPPSEYVDLVDWVRGWVGEARLPHWRTLDKWRIVLRRARAGLAGVEKCD